MSSELFENKPRVVDTPRRRPYYSSSIAIVEACMGNIEAIFGSMVFSDTVMRSLLPHDTYEKLQKMCIRDRACAANRPNEITATSRG